MRRRAPQASRQPSRSYDDHRGSAASRGYGSAHRKWRAAILRRDPFCVLCKTEGRAEAATVADHIVPIAVDPSRRLDLDNGRGLCVRHHAIVTDNFKRTGRNEMPEGKAA